MINKIPFSSSLLGLREKLLALAFYSPANFLQQIEPGCPSVSYHQMCKLTIICSDSISFPLVKQTRTSVFFFFFFLFKVNFMLLKIIPMCIVRNLTESIKLILIYSCFPTHCNIPISLTIVLLSDQYMYIMQKRQTVKLNLCEKEQLLLNCHSCFPEANSANSQLLLLYNSKTCCCSYLFFLFFG